jgi:hypothetical protein
MRGLPTCLSRGLHGVGISPPSSGHIITRKQGIHAILIIILHYSILLPIQSTKQPTAGAGAVTKNMYLKFRNYISVILFK